MSEFRTVVVAVALAVTLSVAGGASVLVVGANHGAEDADYTVEPMSDRSPGATDVRYGQVVVAQAGIDFETLEEMRAVYDEGSWASCGADDGEEFGIDRGNTNDGYETDESLEEKTKTFSTGEDVFRVEFNGEDDFGPSTYLDDGDAVISVAVCIDNPDEPGWYQIEGSMTGVTEDGERVTQGGQSHYFWICDCEDESEAREELGPPPSEPEPTETPASSDDGGEGTDDTPEDDTETSTEGSTDTAEDTRTEAEADTETETKTETETEASSDETGSASTTEADGTPEPTATVESASTMDDEEMASGEGGESGDGSDSDAGGDSWDDQRVRTPTPGSGAGFGAPLALGALLAAALLFRRR